MLSLVPVVDLRANDVVLFACLAPEWYNDSFNSSHFPSLLSPPPRYCLVHSHAIAQSTPKIWKFEILFKRKKNSPILEERNVKHI